MIKTPRFWVNKNIISLLLSPLSLLYWVFFNFDKIIKKPYSSQKFIICIGNINVGGSGKTPTAIAVGKILEELAINYVFLSRGYLGVNQKLMMLKKNTHYDPKITGDEPLLLKDHSLTYICKNRQKAVRELSKNSNFDTIILDDGLQNNSVKKDLNILVIDAKSGFGNKMIFPAGPLRQTIKSGIKKSDIIIVIGKIDLELEKILPNDKLINASIMVKNINKLNKKQYIAFCGIAYPNKFFSLLKEHNINLYKKIIFSDHHNYKKGEINKMLKMASDYNLGIITTKKDWVKFTPNQQKIIDYLDIEIIFSDKNKIKDKIKSLK